MSQEQVNKFLNEVNENKELKSELKEHLADLNGDELSGEEIEQRIEQITSFASDKDYDFTTAEYRSVLESKQKKAKAKLSDEELEQVAGGHNKIDGTGDKVLLSVTTVGIGCLTELT